MTATCKQRQPDTLAYIDSYCFQCSAWRLIVFYTVIKQSAAKQLVSWYFLGSDVLSSVRHQIPLKHISAGYIISEGFGGGDNI